MFAIDTVNIEENVVTTADVSQVKSAFAAAIWYWADQHAEQVLLSRKILFFSVTLKVKDIMHIFEALVGPR